MVDEVYVTKKMTSGLSGTMQNCSEAITIILQELLQSSNDNYYSLTIRDSITRYTWLRAARDMRSEMVIENFKK